MNTTKDVINAYLQAIVYEPTNASGTNTVVSNSKYEYLQNDPKSLYKYVKEFKK